jgi:hypothetical protein
MGRNRPGCDGEEKHFFPCLGQSPRNVNFKVDLKVRGTFQSVRLLSRYNQFKLFVSCAVCRNRFLHNSRKSFSVLKYTNTMIIIFWEMTLCGSYKNRRFGGSYTVFYESLPIQELTSLCNLLALMHPEDGGDTNHRNVGSYKSHTVSSPRR